MSKVRVLLFCTVIAVAVLSPGPAAYAGHCNGTVTQVDTPGATFYVDQRGAPEDGDIWIYQESNNVVGLQSGGTAVSGLYDDACSHDNPDQLIF